MLSGIVSSSSRSASAFVYLPKRRRRPESTARPRLQQVGHEASVARPSSVTTSARGDGREGSMRRRRRQGAARDSNNAVVFRRRQLVTQRILQLDDVPHLSEWMHLDTYAHPLLTHDRGDEAGEQLGDLVIHHRHITTTPTGTSRTRHDNTVAGLKIDSAIIHSITRAR
eukprot:2403231-Pyramimonas_sp.AAC.2